MKRFDRLNSLVVLALACTAVLLTLWQVAAQVPPAPPSDAFKNARGYAVHIACETVDADHYGDGVPDLPATVKDRDAMADLSKKLGYEHLAVLRAVTDDKNAKAIRGNVLKAINDAAQKASGANRDIVLITYSGHGGQVLDDSDDADEPDGQDETWCLYDGMLIDDEIGMAVSKFQSGVRVVFVLDSCHSETATKGVQLSAKNFKDFATTYKGNPAAIPANTPGLESKLSYSAKQAEPEYQVRAISRKSALVVYAKHEEFYKKLATQFNKEQVIRNPQAAKASIITLAACRDNQLALDVGRHGLYTREFLAILEKEGLKLDYNEYQKQVKDKVFKAAQDDKFKDENGNRHQQEPRLTFGGAVPSFADQKLFSIR